MVNQRIFDNLSEPEVVRLAHLLAPLARAGDFLALNGPLGAGKSVFARAFIRTAMGDEALDVPSPTFTLVQHYQPHAPYPEIVHADLYRVEKEEELREIGLEDAGDAIVLLEWPERLGGALPDWALLVDIKSGTDKARRSVCLRGGAVWAERLNKLNLVRA